jgi:transposase, IS6 family
LRSAATYASACPTATVEELLTERVEVDHVTIYRWIQRVTRRKPKPPGRAGTASVTGWQVDETDVKVAGR